MKLQAKSDETRIIYVLSTWEWDSKKQALTQHIPIIEKINFGILKDPQAFTYFSKARVPTLQVGQSVKLDECDMYVVHIDLVDLVEKTVFVYLMSETKPPEISEWWTTEVKNIP